MKREQRYFSTDSLASTLNVRGGLCHALAAVYLGMN